MQPAAPSREQAVIYLVLTDRFANGSIENDLKDECFDPQAPNLFHGGDLQGLRGRLDYLQGLGVTDIWITPVQRQVGAAAVPAVLGKQCAYTGYWAALDDPDPGELEPRLGGAPALRALIDDVHARGMRLIVDYVVNHAGYGAPVQAKHPDWFHAEPSCGNSGVPDETCPLLHLPDFAHEKPEVATYLQTIGQSFVSAFDFDGIRMDTVKHVPEWFFREKWIPAIRQKRPSLYLLGEHFDEGEYVHHTKYLNAGFDALFDFRFRRALLETFGHGASLNRVAERVAEAISTWGIERARLRVTLLDNHDVPRFISEMRDEPAHIKSERYWLALGALFTTPGVPQIHYANELGMEGFWPDNRRDMPSWGFEPETRKPQPGYLGDPARHFAVTQRLATVRRQQPALHAGDYVELWRPGGLPEPVYSFLRRAGSSRAWVVFHHGDKALTEFRIPLHNNPGITPADIAAISNGSLTDALGLWNGAHARVDQAALVVSMPPRSLAVFVNP